MLNRLSRNILTTLLSLCLYLPESTAINVDQQHLEVSLRMIGHQLLLDAGDSTSRVLPIEIENNNCTIRFDAEFSFNPDDLKGLIDSVLNSADIQAEYILQVQHCQSEQIVYSYEVNEVGESDIVPCRSRDQPKSCYNIIVSFTSIESSQSAIVQLHYFVVIILIMSLLSIFLYKYIRNRSKFKKHWISLGKYQFDHRNSILILKEQSTDLTSKEADLLLLLYKAINTTVNRDEILNQVWGDEGAYIGRTLDVFISKLRKKLEADPEIKIVNVRGVGYKLLVDN